MNRETNSEIDESTPAIFSETTRIRTARSAPGAVKLPDAGVSQAQPCPNQRRAGGLAPGALERLLASDEARAIAPGVRDGLRDELAAIKRDLHHRTCSDAWLQQCWSSGEPYPPGAQTTPMRRCGCWRCRRVGRLWPALYEAPLAPVGLTRDASAYGSPLVVEPTPVSLPRDHEFMSYECYLESLGDWEAAQLPSSPSGIALRAIREGRIKVRFRRTRVRGRK